jgi:hypothetical protein
MTGAYGHEQRAELPNSASMPRRVINPHIIFRFKFGYRLQTRGAHTITASGLLSETDAAGAGERKTTQGAVLAHSAETRDGNMIAAVRMSLIVLQRASTPIIFRRAVSKNALV